MKKIFILQLTFSFALNSAVAQNPCIDFEWAVQARGSSSNSGIEIAVDPQGNSYVTGGFHGVATFGDTILTSNGSSDIFITKLDVQGNFLWAKKAGGGMSDVGQEIAVDPQGNSYVAGNFYGTATFGSTTLTSNGSSAIFIAKLDAQGNYLWAKKILPEASASLGVGIAVDSQGNSYVTGQFYGTATFGVTTLTSIGISDIFIIKLDGQGNFLWAKQGNVNGAGHGIAVDSQENVYVTGFCSDTVTGHPVTFITKLDAQGNSLWAKQAEGMHNRGYGIGVDPQGNSYVTGTFYDTVTFGGTTLTSIGISDIFITKLDGQGNFLWVKKTGVGYAGSGHGIAVDSQGNSYVTGSWRNNSTEVNTFITKLDGQGNFLWAKQGDVSYDSSGCSGHGIGVDPQGNSYVTGDFNGTPTFGGTTLTVTGATYSSNTFIAKLSNCNEEVGIASLDASSIQIFPNPSSSFFTIADAPVGAMLSITDYTGKPVYNQLLMSEQTVLTTSTFTNGIYFINITHNGIRTVEKLIINK